MHFKVKIERSAKARLGEGPLWDSQQNKLYYVDIEGKNIRSYNPSNGEEHVLPLPQRCGSIALCKDGRMLAALQDGIYYVSDNGIELAHDKMAIKGYRFNDGKVGPDSCFYAGTMSEEGKGAFYRLSTDGRLHELFDGVSISNGLDWSTDGQTMYYVDTPTQRLDAFDFDKDTSTLSNRRTVIDIPAKLGHPDGLCTDSQDMIYLALWGGNSIVQIDPHKGEIIKTYATPAAQTTCCTYGGADLKTLYITSADIGRGDEPSEAAAGYLFSLAMKVGGKPSYRFG